MAVFSICHLLFLRHSSCSTDLCGTSGYMIHMVPMCIPSSEVWHSLPSSQLFFLSLPHYTFVKALFYICHLIFGPVSNLKLQAGQGLVCRDEETSLEREVTSSRNAKI